MKHSIILLLNLLTPITIINAQTVQFGCYYYDGWAGIEPYGVTAKLKNDFPKREPIWGWRDDDIAVMEKQIDVASKNGIDFFTFCWYWADSKYSFNEKDVVECLAHSGLELFMRAKNKKKMKFSILIANHEGSKILGEDNWCKAVDFLSKRYFKDAQYLQVDGKPAISVYIPQDAEQYLFEMNKNALKNGFNGLYIISCGYSIENYNALSWYNYVPTEKVSESRDFAEHTSRMEKGWAYANAHTNLEILPLCVSGWDKRPWESSEKTIYYVNRKPSVFYKHLCNAIDFIQDCKSEHQIVMVYAWNEYGEGGYLAPTKGDPHGRFLKQIKKAKRYAKRKR